MLGLPKCYMLLHLWKALTEASSASGVKMQEVLGRMTTGLHQAVPRSGSMEAQRDLVALMAASDLVWKKIQGTYVLVGAYLSQVC